MGIICHFIFYQNKKRPLNSPVFFLNPQRRTYFFQAFKTDICKASKRSRVGRKTNSKIAPLDNSGPLITVAVWTHKPFTPVPGVSKNQNYFFTNKRVELLR